MIFYPIRVCHDTGSYGIIALTMSKASLKSAMLAAVVASLCAIGVFAAVESHDDLAEAVDPEDATNGGFWDTTDRSPTSIYTAMSGEESIDGLYRTIACSEPTHISSTAINGMMIIAR